MKARGVNLALTTLAVLGLSLTSAYFQPAHAQAAPYKTVTNYDVLGRVTGTRSPDPDAGGPLKYPAVRNTYDTAGRLVKVESGELATWQFDSTPPAAWSGFTVYKTIETSYDAQNQKTFEVVKGSDGVATAATQYKYDSLGQLQCTAVRMDPAQWPSQTDACAAQSGGPYGPDRITKNLYNNRGELTTIQKAFDTALAENYATYTFSGNGNRTSVTDARGFKASMEFDGFDRQVRWNFPSPDQPGVVDLTNFEQYGYDDNGNRTSFKKRDGSTLTYGYDSLNRMTSKIVPERAGLDASHTRDVYYEYDSFGRMTNARFDSSAGNDRTWTGYNGFSEITSTGVLIGSFSASYSFTFDANGNRDRVNYSGGNYVTYGFDGLDRPIGVYRSGTATLVSYTYNARGARAAIGGSFATSYGYYPDGRLSSLTNTPIAPNYTAQYSFSYNPASQISQLARTNDVFAWASAPLPVQNYTANGLNQYTALAGASVSHDGNGNLTSDGATTYIYDVENRLVAASGASTAVLRYDPMGRLYELTGGPGGLIRFSYDGDRLTQELSNSGALLRRYVHGTDAGDDPVAWFEGSGFTDTEQRLLRSDHQGSIVAVADATSANILAVNTYDEYGVPNSANRGRFQYTGQAWITELGLYYYKARMYSPKLGRFMQTDPIGYEDDLNLYAYVGNSPLSSTDPDGKTEVTITVQRTQETTHSTMGTVSATNGTTTVSGYSLEPPKNADPSGNGTTSVKSGTYGAFVRTAASSNDHNYDSVELKGSVPGNDGKSHTNIQIHRGNEPTDSKGCILVGKTQQTDKVSSSRVALDRVMNLISTTQQTDQANGQATTIKVVINDPVQPPAQTGGSK